MEGQISVRNAGGFCGSGEPSLRVEVAVRVDVDDVGLPAGVDAQVDAAVVAALQRFEGCLGHRDAPGLERWSEERGLRGAVEALGALGVPLGGVREHARPGGEGRAAETNLG